MMAEVINGTQRDIGRLEGRIEGLEKKITDVDRHVSKLEAKVTTRMDTHYDSMTEQHTQLRDDINSIKMATQNNKMKIAMMGGLLTGSATVGGLISKFMPFFGK